MSLASVDVGRGITLTYEQLGAAGGEPVVLIAGLGQQLHSWPDGFCELLVAQGYRVLRFDNRDVGESTHLDFPPAKPVAMLRRQWHPRQYDLGDLAADTVGLFDALNMESAHMVGASMGGMIAQAVAAAYPDRVRSLTSIMSTTGAARIGRPALSTWRLMMAAPSVSKAEYSDRAVRMFRHIGSAGFPFEERRVRAEAELVWDRDPRPAAGVGRQLSGILKSGDRTRELRSVTAPTLVIHGDRDRMVNPTGGAGTAAAIRGARLETVRGLGHDLPSGAWQTLANLIDTHVQNALLAATINRSSDAPSS
jgi:pimeloyl-ACP methyl ester carboxylesterase